MFMVGLVCIINGNSLTKLAIDVMWEHVEDGQVCG